jgi:hypothetical protein
VEVTGDVDGKQFKVTTSTASVEKGGSITVYLKSEAPLTAKVSTSKGTTASAEELTETITVDVAKDAEAGQATVTLTIGGTEYPIEYFVK